MVNKFVRAVLLCIIPYSAVAQHDLLRYKPYGLYSNSTTRTVHVHVLQMLFLNKCTSCGFTSPVKILVLPDSYKAQRLFLLSVLRIPYSRFIEIAVKHPEKYIMVKQYADIIKYSNDNTVLVVLYKNNIGVMKKGNFVNIKVIK